MCVNKAIKSKIRKIKFEKRGFITFYLEDGRIIFDKISNYKEVKKLSTKQRKDYEIIEGQFFSFIDIQEIYSIEEILRLK